MWGIAHFREGMLLFCLVLMQCFSLLAKHIAMARCPVDGVAECSLIEGISSMVDIIFILSVWAGFVEMFSVRGLFSQKQGLGLMVSYLLSTELVLGFGISVCHPTCLQLLRLAEPRPSAANSSGIRDVETSAHLPRLAQPRIPADGFGIRGFEVLAQLPRFAPCQPRASPADIIGIWGSELLAPFSQACSHLRSPKPQQPI